MDYFEPPNQEVVGLTAKDYSNLTEREHVLARPDMYIDSIIQTPRPVWFLVNNDGEMSAVIGETSMPLGLTQLFDEIDANAFDNITRTIKEGKGIDPGHVEINFDGVTMSVKNYGLPIPVVPFDETGITVPELVFTRMRAGSNFGRKRHGAGRNGMGVTIVVINSRYARATVGDHIHKVGYDHTWEHNMSQTSGAIFTDYDSDVSFVHFEYVADLPHFGYIEECYPPEALSVFMMRAATASFSCKSEVIFNGDLMNYSHPLSFVRLFTREDPKNYLLSYAWDNDIKVKRDKFGAETAEDNIDVPNIELIVADTPGRPLQLGIWNSIINEGGGIHLTAAINAVKSAVLKIITKKKNKRPEKDHSTFGSTGEKVKPDVKISDEALKRIIKENTTIIVNVHIPNPIFNGQSKNIVRGYMAEGDVHHGKLDITISDKITSKMKKWALIAKIYEHIAGLLMKQLKKTDGKKNVRVESGKGEDAEWASTAKAYLCTMILFEGDSAMAYARCIRSYTPDGTKRLILLPVDGKIVNVINLAMTPKDIERLMKDPLFNRIKDYLGLREGVDYRDEGARKTLRAGSIMIMADSDLDGLHIKMLLIAFFSKYYPSLLEIGMIIDWRTKRAVATKGKERMVFYYDWEIEQWKRNTPDWKLWHIEYYKGLATSDEEAALEDYNNRYIVRFTYNDTAKEWIEMVMNKAYADYRKQWIIKHDVNRIPKIYDFVQPIQNFINDEFVNYCRYTLKRHLPGRDGLCLTERKIVYVMTRKWKWWKLTGEKSIMRVDQLAAYVISKACYQHGNPEGVIIRMAQTFAGANNCPMLYPKGQFGTILSGGKDAGAARYLKTYPVNWFMKHMLNVRDEPLLKFDEYDGECAEPIFYPFLLPPHLINGRKGIGTGWASTIPNHHPLEVAYWLIDRLRGKPYKEMPQLVPWYRGFTGLIEIRDNRKTDTFDVVQDYFDLPDEPEEGEEGEEETDISPFMSALITRSTGKYSMVTHGIVQNPWNDTATVTELPIGAWVSTYKERRLRKWKKEGRIKDYFNNSTIRNVSIDVKGMKILDEEGNIMRKPDINDFALKKSMGLGNMIVIDENSVPMRFGTAKALLEDYLQWRLPIFEERRQYEMKQVADQIRDLTSKLEFVTAVIDRRLILSNADNTAIDSAVLDKEIARLKLDKKHTSIGINQVTKQSVQRLKKEIENKQQELAKIEATNAEEIYISDIEAFILAYTREYGDDRPVKPWMDGL